MTKFTNIIHVEIKKMMGKSFWIFIILFILFTFIDNYLKNDLFFPLNSVRSAGNFGLSLSLIELYFIYLGATCVSQEFNLKTSTIVFSNPFSRAYIIHSKLISLFIVATCFALINIFVGETISIIGDGSNINFREFLTDALKLIWVYNLFVFCSASVGLLVSIITLNRVISLLISYGLFVILGDIVARALTRGNFKIANIVEKMYFYVSPHGFSELNYSMNQSTYLLVISCIIYLISLYILKRRDLN